LLANELPLGDFIHCHDAAEQQEPETWYTGAVYVQVPGVAYAGICTDTDLPLPPGDRIRPMAGTGDATPQALFAQGCDPAWYVQIIDFQFDPPFVTVPQGITVRWKSDGPSVHTATYTGPLKLWDSGPMQAGDIFSKRLTAAGTYAFHCKIHPQMKASMALAVEVSPSSGSRSKTFTITLAKTRATDGFVYDVEVRKGNGKWVTYQTGVRNPRLRFKPLAKGTYSFRSRLRKGNAATGWSPGRSISVS
jgi:plastocyanin